MSRPDGNDVSKWQDNNATKDRKVDFAKMKAAGSEFCYIRAKYGIWDDEDAVDHGKLARDANMLFGWYGFCDYKHYDHLLLYSKERLFAEFQTQDPLIAWGKQQARALWLLIKSNPGSLAPVIDGEEWKADLGPITYLNINRVLKIMLAELQEIRLLSKGVYKPFTVTIPTLGTITISGNPGFYSNYGIEKQCSAAFGDFWLFHAGYPVLPFDDMLPENYMPRIAGPWKTCVLWQYDSEGHGKEFGAESEHIDRVKFMGTHEELPRFGANNTPDPTLPLFDEDTTPEPTGISRKEFALATVVCASNLNYRGAPGTAAAYLGTIPTGTKDLVILETRNDNRANPWARIGYKQWAALRYNGEELLKFQ